MRSLKFIIVTGLMVATFAGNAQTKKKHKRVKKTTEQHVPVAKSPAYQVPPAPQSTPSTGTPKTKANPAPVSVPPGK